MPQLRRSTLLSYGFAVLVVALAATITWLFPLLSSRIPFALFYAAVMLSAWYGGKGPGLMATALSALLSIYSFIFHKFSSVTALEGILLLSVFLLVSVVISFLTDRARRAEVIERVNREQLLTMLRSIGDAVIATDARGRVNFMNQVAQKLTGWTLEEAEGKELREVFQIVNEQTRREVESPVDKVIREGTIVGLANHTVLIAKGGHETPIDDSGAPIKDEEGNITGVVLVFRDIAERRQAEELRQRLASIVESSEDAIIGKTLEGIITSWNVSAERLYGYSAEEVVGRPISILVPPDRPDEVPGILERLKRGERVEHFETKRVRKDGEVLDIALTISPIKNDAGTIIGASTIARDITEEKRTAEALRESEERLRQALEAARMGTWEWNIETGTLSWSDTLEPLHGLTPGTFTGSFEAFSELVHPEDRQLLSEAITHAIEKGTNYDLEFRVVWPDGSIHWIEGKGRAFLDETGKAVRMTGLGLDITDRKRAEEALRAGEQRYRAFVRNSSEAIWRFELEEPISINLPEAEQIDLCYRYGYLAECNDAMAEMYGFKRAEEIVGAKLSDLLVREDERNVEFLRAFIQSDYRLTEAESHEVDREGNPKYFLNNLVGIIEGGKLLRAWGTQRDITGRRLVEEERTALLVSEQAARQAAERAAQRTARLQSITAALSEALTPAQAASAVLSDGLSAVGAHAGSVALLTNHGKELELLDAVGFPAEMVEKWQRFPVTVETPLGEAVRTGKMVLLESLQTGEPRYPHLSNMHTANGTQALAAIPLIVEGRTIGAMGLTFRETRKFEKDDSDFMLAIARQCAQAIERARLYQAERHLRNEAEEANRTKDEFLATLSHELRTPLTAMLGWTRMLRMKELDETTSMHALETVERNAKAQAQLIEDLLDVSRIITGKLRLDVRPIRLVPIIEAAIDAVRPATDAKSIELQTKLDPLAGPVYGDPARLQQVVWNLLANAVKFTPEDGRVEVQLARVDSHVEITVSDTGQGITADFLPYVFDRFRQADGSTTRMHGGLGLGLAIVRHLVELHGGTVQAQSAGTGRGATFKVQLPLTQLRSTDFGLRLDEKTEEKPTLRTSHSALEGLRVLVVDDEPDALALIRMVLENQGASVAAVGSAREALDALERQKPDVLISDIGMPDEDGYTLIRQVRALSKAQGGHVPAAAVSAYVGEDNRRQALAAGFQIHVAKPLDPEELITVVRNLAKSEGMRDEEKQNTEVRIQESE